MSKTYFLFYFFKYLDLALHSLNTRYSTGNRHSADLGADVVHCPWGGGAIKTEFMSQQMNWISF